MSYDHTAPTAFKKESSSWFGLFRECNRSLATRLSFSEVRSVREIPGTPPSTTGLRATAAKKKMPVAKAARPSVRHDGDSKLDEMSGRGFDQGLSTRGDTELPARILQMKFHR